MMSFSKSLFFLCLASAGTSLAQTDMVSIDPYVALEAQSVISEENYDDDRQEQEEELFDEDLSYEDQYVNSYETDVFEESL